ncbi:hypothetical protein CVT24_000995 [Panaeolus cyanescens]|uniref:F-box domain-containing protein n=1 Tax=Panaeolus cyanescens TaxID=181874 RepID=A0A409YCG7_9AGAR|nr:hypothetical protein CVT24_000995 [Panaeolus cyanescens]
MHKVLNNPFILRHIFDQWEPADVKPCCYNSALALSGPVPPSDLEKLQTFGRRVRVYHTSETEEQIDPSVYIIISGALKGNPLFPNLQSIHFYIRHTHPACHAASLIMLFSPSLRDARLTPIYPRGHFNFSFFIQRLVDAPQMTDLSVEYHAFCQKQLDAVLSLKNLTSLAFDMVHTLDYPYVAFNRTVLASLAKLERLQSLAITLSPADWVTRDPDSEENELSVFPNLTTLKLNCLFEDAYRFLTLAKLPSLKRLVHNFRFTSESEPTKLPDLPWNGLLGALKASTTSELTSLEVNPAFGFRRDNRARELLWLKIETGEGLSFAEIADNLLQLNLTSLKFDFPLFRSLSEADFAAMGHAWPTLTSLYVRVISKRAPTPNTTILKLIKDTFPHLSQLGIDIEAGYIDEPCMTTSSANPLRSIEARLFNWEETWTAKFAALVDSLFPQLDSFSHWINTCFHDVKTNPAVHNRVLELQQARRRERNWIRSEYRMPELVQAKDEDEVVYASTSNDTSHNDSGLTILGLDVDESVVSSEDPEEGGFIAYPTYESDDDDSESDYSQH